MDTYRFLFRVLILFIISSVGLQNVSADTQSLNHGWKFSRGDHPNAERLSFNDTTWGGASLPHTAHVEPLVVNDQWMGICWYRKLFHVSPSQVTGKVFIEFEGAMNYAKVWINGKLVTEHHGGYLPIVLDATSYIQTGSNLIAVRLDNTDNPVTGPKPHFKTDFCKYGGLYRNVWIHFQEKVYISHPQLVDKIAGGGVFITTPVVSEEVAVVRVKTHLVNELAQWQLVTVRQTVLFGEKHIVNEERDLYVPSGGSTETDISFNLTDAQLWSPENPNLYRLQTDILLDGEVVETRFDRFGIREFVFKDNQLYINGERTFLRGVNRHQEFPYIGYALSDNAQVRDAKLIKEAGFDLIRLSHYPHSPAFMDACDELGIVVLDAILGWQYYSEDKAFNDYCFRSARDLVRRDRNHPCVLAWEVSLNETTMPIPFMQKLHDIVHAEYPGDKVYTCGWQPEVYDIYVQARQHRILHGRDHIGEKPFLVSEYGDWEYYSRNGGLNQHKLDFTTRLEKSSRQLRGFGEARLQQQVFNVQEAHNDNRYTTPAFADAYWVMFDYNSGCHSEQCYCGLMDIFRLPKPAYWFYCSQRDPEDAVVLHIASYWNQKSPLDIKVFSNCDEVELFLNGISLGRQRPDSDRNSSALEHPPFTFHLKGFEPGELKALGYIADKKTVEHVVKTPGEPVALKMWLDDVGVPLEKNDTVFVRVAAIDANGTIVPDYAGDIDFSLPKGASLLNTGAIEAEAGIATGLISIAKWDQPILLSASTGHGIKSVTLEIDSPGESLDRRSSK